MNERKRTGTNRESLMNMLASKDGVIRQNAREALVALGKPAVSSLTQALMYKREHVSMRKQHPVFLFGP